MLSGEPAGNLAGPPLGTKIDEGTIVEIFDRRPPRFVKVRKMGVIGGPEGWVTSVSVKEGADSVPQPESADMAAVCAEAADSFGVNAHFLMAYAHFRSGLKTGMLANGVEKGPFGFSAAEWAYFGNRTDMGVILGAELIDSWQEQGLVSALRMMLTQNLAAEALGRQPNAAELALAHMCGPKTAAAVIADAAGPVTARIAANGTEDAESAGVDRANINLRFAEFLAGQSGKAALDKIGASLQASLDATRASMQALGGAVIGAASGAIGSSAAASVTIEISDDDMDALARVSMSEVSIFEQFGADQLKGGVEAVVDTVLNRVANEHFRSSIQAVIDQPLQFSAINDLKSWKKLPKASAKVASIVETHIAQRLAGAPSIIKGAVNFLNPKSSSPGPMAAWGNFVVKHAVAVFGDPDSPFVHYHGTAPGFGKPRDYLLRRGGQQAHFDPDGMPSASLVAAAAGALGGVSEAAAGGIAQRIVQNVIAEWNFFKQGTCKEADDPQFKRIGDYWNAVGETFDGRSQIPDPASGGTVNPAWSSAFISFIIQKSGGGDRFLYSQAHSNYVQDFVKGRPNGLYEALRPEGCAPVPGDIIHSGREGAKRFDFDAARERFKADHRYSSHSDFVIEVLPEEGVIITIGGNVSQSVAQKRLKINADGTLKKRVEGGQELPWIAVLRCLG
jgi:hypothetical protein